MKAFDHVYQLHQLLRRSRYPVPIERIRDELCCSLATTKRVIAFLRDQLRAPIQTSRDPRGYRYADQAFELPGVWFNAAELHSLLALQMLLSQFQPGFLDKALNPLKKQLTEILQKQGLSTENVDRIRLVKIAAREAGQCFAQVADALLQRRRLEICYVARTSGEKTIRTVSPQRLVHYRDNWYLDAWCHSANSLRTFALDCIQNASMAKGWAKSLEDGKLDRELGSSYGIFSGVPTKAARLRFSSQRARWVSGYIKPLTCPAAPNELTTKRHLI